jgi:hypothetical protein
MSLLVGWCIFNIFIGIWEVYVFYNRDKLVLEKESFWTKLADGKITFSNFWLESWNEYCKADSRYIFKQYVWVFELLNAVFAVLLAIVIVMYGSNKKLVKLLIGLTLINCIVYFASLAFEFFQNNIIKHNIIQYTTLKLRIAYYLISSMWIIMPLILLY